MLQPPTDNLYKFCALSGLIILFSSIYFPIQLLIDVHAKTGRLSTEIAIHSIEVSHLEDQMADMKEIVSNTLQRGQSGFLPQTNRIELIYSDQEIKTMLCDLRSSTKDKLIAIEKLDHYQSEIDDLLRFSSIIRLLGCLASGIGMFMAIYGFKCWHNRIQVHEDRVLAKSAGNSNL